MLRTVPITEQFEEIARVNALALEAFPPEEYLSPSEMISMSEDDDFDFWALYDENAFAGFMTVMTHKEQAYLFFLAIDWANRSRGLGAQAIKLLTALYPNKTQVVDMEMLDDRADNREQRERRREFYLRNGYRTTGQYLSYLGVDYEVLCMDDRFDLAIFKELMGQIRIAGFCPRYFSK